MTAAQESLKKWLPALCITAGLLGLFASVELTLQKINVLQNPAFAPPCNISPFISCGSIMNSWQSELFGFPNSLLGVIGFPIIITIGFTLFAGAQYKKWFWLSMQTGVTVAVIFVFWFFSQSVFVIHSLCPWCMVFWAATLPLFWYVTLCNLQDNDIELFSKHPHLPLLALYGIIAITILVYFWPYWSTLF